MLKKRLPSRKCVFLKEATLLKRSGSTRCKLPLLKVPLKHQNLGRYLIFNPLKILPFPAKQLNSMSFTACAAALISSGGRVKSSSVSKASPRAGQPLNSKFRSSKRSASLQKFHSQLSWFRFASFLIVEVLTETMELKYYIQSG